MSLARDIQQPAPGVLIDLYQLDLTVIGFPVPIFYFHAGTEPGHGELLFDGHLYQPMPITISGFESKGDGPLPRPTMVVSNLSGAITEQMLLYNEFIGAKVTRIRTLAKYLDRGSSPDPTAKVTEVYFVEQKKSENKLTVTFELVSPIDIMDKQLPGRPMISNTCIWGYKSLECSWPGTDSSKYFDNDDNPTINPLLDSCSKKLSGCKARFGALAELPFGGFPALGRTQ